MNAPKRDELRERRLEETLARRMGEALDRLSPQETGECPDAEIIAAYHEQALGPDESTQWERHFAGCSRCRKILAVLGASVEEPLSETEVARLGELVAASDILHGARSKNTKPLAPNRWDWRVRWLAPALGVAAALAVWFAMRPPWRAVSPESSGTLVAQVPKSEPPPNAEPRDRLSPPEAAAERRAASSNTIGPVSPSAGGSVSALQDEKKLEGRTDETPNRPAAPPPPPPLPNTQGAIAAQAPPQPKVSAGAGTFAEESRQAQANGDAVGSASSLDKIAPAPQPAARAMVAPEASPRPAMSARNAQNLDGFKANVEIPVLLRAPSASTFLRVGKGGSIERSTDAGRTWTLQSSPSSDDWLAGEAVSDTIAWLVGRNGAIARTVDGEHWERVAPPPQAADSSAKSPDWTAITAQDAQIATITARDGRRFTTQDGGKTWRLLPN